MVAFKNLLPGDPAPMFIQRSYGNPSYSFDTAAGRYLVLCFFLSSDDDHSRAAFQSVVSRGDLFNDEFACFFGVTTDPLDDTEKRVSDRYPGYRFFMDMDLSISRLYGAVDVDATEAPSLGQARRIWVVLDPTMRIMNVITFKRDQSDCAELISYMDSLPPPDQFLGMPVQAPILILPNVFEPDLCEALINLYDTEGSIETGFMKDEGGKTVGVLDAKHKRRRDHYMKDDALISRVQERFTRRVVPEIAKIHQYEVTRMERYIVGCYTEEDGGHFMPHRDNTTKGTAHRRFAVSVNLNEDFDGGEVMFPEYGRRTFKAPAGGAVVFSCSLLHAVTKITRGRRYAFLPFLYNDSAAAIRQENLKFLSGDNGAIGEEKQPESEAAEEKSAEASA